jgi:CHAT domain-containing protein
MRFMTLFYEALAQGHDKGEALRQVQRCFVEGIGNPETADFYQHPYFWAPFYLVGDAGPL